MTTPASGDDPYCTVDQLLLAYDQRVVRQLLSDAGVAVTGVLDDEPILLFLLGAASGDVEAAACTGQRYVIDENRNDLAELTGNSKLFLAKMVADLAMHDLWLRRLNGKPGDRPTVKVQKAEDFLERLRLGERVFGILEHQQAAKLDSSVESRNDVSERRGVIVEADRFFGVRNNRLGPY